MTRSAGHLDPHAPRCWACDAPVPRARIETESALRARVADEGGPYRVFLCSGCHTENGVVTASGNGCLLYPLTGRDLEWGEALTARLLQQVLPGRALDKAVRAEHWWRRHGAQIDSFVAHARVERATGRRREPAPKVEPRPRPQAAPRRPKRPRRPRKPRKGSPRDVLGVGLDTTLDEVRAAFRRAVKRFHPDRYAHLDAASQLRAHRRFMELRQAYDALVVELQGRAR